MAAKAKFKKFKNAFGPKRSGFKALPDLPVVKMIDFESEEERELERKLKDEKLAKRLSKLRDTLPYATVPELVTFDWLRYNKYNFIYQVEVGERGRKGSKMPDFVVNLGGQGLAWQVQGEYWHSGETTRAQDRALNAILRGQEIAGTRIVAVVELWEDDIYDKRPRVFEEAIRGRGLRA